MWKSKLTREAPYRRPPRPDIFDIPIWNLKESASSFEEGKSNRNKFSVDGAIKQAFGYKISVRTI